MAKTRRAANIAHAFPAEFLREPSYDDRHAADLWHRWRDTGEQSAAETLFAHYAPLVRIMAFRTKRCRPDFYGREPVENLIAHGAVGVWRYILNNRETSGIVLNEWVRRAAV